jgi:selenoprotein W-related protein
LTDELLSQFGHHVESLTLIPSSGGRFEVIVDGDLIFSKVALERHAEPGEVARRFAEKTGLTPAQ